MVSEKKLKLGIIGFERIAAAHANSVLDLHDSTELTALDSIRKSDSEGKVIQLD